MAPTSNTTTTSAPLEPVALRVRLLAGALALSGAIYALLAWIIPFFWPGYFIWGAWIAIAFGVRRFNKPWFWMSSAIWNFGMSALLLSSTDWALHNKALVYWLCRIHSVAAFVLSFTTALSLMPPPPKSTPFKQ